MKEDLQDEKVNMKKDIILFGDKIARFLDISVRFVGEEKNDNVTNQYNVQMKEILPKYGVEVIEIPRKKSFEGKEVISASLIRKKYQMQRLEDIKELVPMEVYHYLKEKIDGLEKRT